MKTHRLSRRWQRQYRKLFERQRSLLRQCRGSGGHDEIHDFRVALRRLRLMLQVAGPLADSKPARQYLLWSHRILNATSRLRDCDAVLEWLTPCRDAGPMREELDRLRQRLWRVARAKLEPLPSKIRHRLSRIQLTQREKACLEERFGRHFSRLQSWIASHLPGFLRLAAEEQHAFRRKLRRLRYLREIALPHRQQRNDPWLTVVIQLQTAMGECQNLSIAEQLLPRAGRAPVPSTLLEAMTRERAAWEKEIYRGSRKLQSVPSCAGARR